MKPIIAITMGDAAGIGPEIVVKALAREHVHQLCRPIVIGDVSILRRALGWTGVQLEIRAVREPEEATFGPGILPCIDLQLLTDDLPVGRVDARAGNAAYHYLAKAVELAKEGRVDAICTAPLNKEALHLAGHRYPGHTEILAHLTGSEDYAMMLTSPKLKVIHLTTHVGLRKAIDLITPQRTYDVIKMAHDAMVRAGREKPSIAVCGINPHAGENGLFGEGEEEEKLVPAIRMARLEGIDVSGPYPADTLFYRAVKGDFDIVVACYHDQGHTPVKVLGIDTGVNITVGLKGGVVRTSVDHGTAFDIAGKNLCDESSMLAAIQAAVELAPKRE